SEAKTKPSVGGLTDASLEKIISLHPDLVLAMAEINREETVDQLEHVAIPVYVVSPQALQGIMASIQHIGDALNRTSDAVKLLKRLEEQRTAVVARVKGLPRPLKHDHLHPVTAGAQRAGAAGAGATGTVG